jgi:hypothetical protein
MVASLRLGFERYIIMIKCSNLKSTFIAWNLQYLTRNAYKCYNCHNKSLKLKCLKSDDLGYKVPANEKGDIKCTKYPECVVDMKVAVMAHLDRDLP